MAFDRIDLKPLDDRNHFGLLKIFTSKDVLKNLNTDFIKIDVRLKGLAGLKELYTSLKALEGYRGYMVFIDKKIYGYVEIFKKSDVSFIRINVLPSEYQNDMLDKIFKELNNLITTKYAVTKYNNVIGYSLKKSNFILYRKVLFGHDDYFVMIRNVVDTLYNIDNLYEKEFSNVKKVAGGVIYEDLKMPNKPSNNYLSLDSYYTTDDLKWYYDLCVKNNRSFAEYKIKSKLDINKFSFLGEIDRIDISYMLVNGDITKRIDERNDVVVKKIDEETEDDFIRIMYVDSKPNGEEYAKKNSMRLFEAIIKNKSMIDYYFIYLDKIVVGYVSAFKVENILKIEDFVISPKYQHMGFGKTLLKKVLEKYTFDYVYVACENNDEIKEIYKKFGFKEVGEAHFIRKFFKQ